MNEPQHMLFIRHSSVRYEVLIITMKLLGNSTHNLASQKKHLFYRSCIFPITLYGHCKPYTCQISSLKALWQILAQSSLSSYKSYYQVVIRQFTILYNFSSSSFTSALQTQTVTKNQGSYCRH